MPTNIESKRVYDGFTSLEGGQDSRTDPSLLAQNQGAFFGNISLRGNIPETRPPYLNKLLGFENTSVEANFTGRFQGACFYETNDESENSIISSVGGRLFRIYLDAGMEAGTGQWQNTGFLNTERWFHTAALLSNGNVLIVGGLNDIVLSSCELYDPTTGIWTPTGSLNTARYTHTEILLPNGKVLVSGGTDDVGNTISSCELYDPTSGTWAYTGTLNTARAGHGSILLSNGKVLTVGGSDGINTISSCELYDPTSGTWAYTGALHTANMPNQLVLLSNGKVLITGGYDTQTNPISDCELYDPVSKTWSVIASLNTGRVGCGASLLTDGKVIVSGGFSGSSFFSSCELYDPTTGTWSYTSSMNAARSNHTSLLLNSGEIVVAGGLDSFSPILTTEFYDSISGTWSYTGSLNTARAYHTSTLLSNNKILVSGGQGGYVSFLTSAELFTPNYYSTTVTDITPNVAELVTENFVVPAVGQTVTIYVTDEHEFTIGQSLIIDSGSYTVTALGANQITVKYNGGAANTNWLVVPNEIIYAADGVTQVVATNVPELVTITTAVPLAATQVTLPITWQANGAPFTTSQNLLIDGGSYTIISLNSNQIVAVYNGGAANSSIAANTNITGNQVNSETTTGFTVPAIGASASIPVINKADFTNGHYILIDSGSYLITSVAANPITATYEGGAANSTVASGTVILSDTNITATIPEAVTNNFIVPALNQQVTISPSNYQGFSVNQIIVIDGDNFTVNTLLSAQNQIVVTYTGGTAHVILDTGILDGSGNQIYFAHTNPADADMVFMYQAENYVIILCENQSTIIYDGSNTVLADQSQQQLQSSYVGVYAWGRNWIAQVNGHRFVASDLVGDPSGSPSLAYVDAILYMTENALLNGGGAFSTPANLGMITAMSALSQLDSSLGIGPVLVGTVNSIFSVQAPTDRTTWQNLRYPIQSVALQGAGPVGPRQMITINSDAWFRSLDGVRSMMAARRDFKSNQSNTPNSLEMSPVFDTDDESLLYYGSLASFDNRLFITASPYRTSYGIAHRALAVVNFDSISNMGKQSPPIWEGLWTGLNILQILSGQINGVLHCYAFVLNSNGGIDLWELLPEGNDQTYDVLDQITDGVESLTQTPIYSWIDTRVMNFGDPFQLKKLIMAELYLDEIVDAVSVKVYFKPDQYPLWTLWTTISICANVSQCTFQGTSGGNCLMWQEQLEQYGARLRLPRPPETANNITGQPIDRGYEFQFRLEITGNCRIRKFKAHAFVEQQAMEGECPPTVTCKTLTGCSRGWFDYTAYGSVAALGAEAGEIIGAEAGEIIGAEI